MIDRTTRLRWRRRLRRGKRQVEDMSVQAEVQLERHFFKRLAKLPGVLRFSLTWVLLLLLIIGGVFVQSRALDNYYLVDKPVPGGIYTEGILGSFTNASPLYAASSTNNSVSRLVFSGLFKLDSNNNLVGDLADSWSVDKTAQIYTVQLHDNLVWQDNQPLTAEDVVFTYETIQNPDSQSPLLASWQDVSVKAPNSHTVVFTLPNPLSSFPYSMTNGIVPKHLLKDVPVAQLRSVNFNTANPVGAGPFRWSAVQVSGSTLETREEQIALLPFDNYVRGKPKLSKFIIRSFHDEKQLLASFRRQELNGASGLSDLPPDLQKDTNIQEYDIPLLSEVMVFFKNSSSILRDAKVRQALVSATNKTDIISNLGYPVAAAKEPLLKTQLGYDKHFTQPGYSLDRANKLLDSAGWKPGIDGIRAKKNVPLIITLSSQDSPDYTHIAEQLKKQWRAVGVNLQIDLKPSSDLQTKLANHDYDALLYGIELGKDPDVFPYWDSTQADVRSQNRLNFSEYKSAVADTSLEAGRTRLDPALRIIKYRPFLQTWHNDAPAIALYQPRFLYVTRGRVFGFTPTSISNGIGRYANVNNWMIREDKLPK